MRRLVRLARWLWLQLGEFVGLLLCLVMVALLVPLVPIMKSCERAREFFEGDGDE